MNEASQTKTDVGIDYAKVPVDIDSQLRISLLLWFSSPAAVACALLAESIREITATPGDPTAGLVATTAFVLVMLISLISSGAVVLAVLEGRKTIANVLILAVNVMWVIACIGWFFARIAS